MKKLILPFLAAFYFSGPMFAQTITISEARTKALGTQVTITGFVTCDTVANYGVRYMQDLTAGIAIFSYDFGEAVSRGDSVTVTGTLKNYQNLLEIDPVASWEIHSSDNPLPEPILVTPSQIAEQHEGMLVKIENVIFTEGGQEFSSKEYQPAADGDTFQVYVHANSPLMGEVVPSPPVTMVGIVSQFWEVYQLVVRDINDLIILSEIYLTSSLEMTNLSQTGFDLAWTTNVAGSTEILFGNTPDLELGRLATTDTSTEHSISITGREPAELLYFKPISVYNGDTTISTPKVFITQSASSGDMKAYFNRTVDTSVSTGAYAVQLFEAIDDTLISYIDRAKYTLDLTIYNYNTTGISDITTALNAAHSRGVEIRIVSDFNIEDNNGWAGLDAAIGRIVSPEDNYEAGIGIMHNKFVVFDANSPDPNDPLVWTGSTNFTDGQINMDPNNVIIIQDQSLAKTYCLEFEEMFGSSGMQPDPVNAKFGPYKANNTPHEFIIGGSRVESYFSPSDGVNSQIEAAILTADHGVYVNTMLNTRTALAYAVTDMADLGVDAKFIVNSEGQCVLPGNNTIVVDILQNLGANFRDYAGSGILHHKTLIVDQAHADADPLVLTGCHNWSSSADTRNDENTLIIHNQEIANIYYQEFVERFKQGEVIGDTADIPEPPEAKNDFTTMDQGDTLIFDPLDNDDLPGAVTVNITSGPFHGTASMDANGVITYIPDPEFAWLDTIIYKVCLVANSGFCDSASFVINVKEVVGIDAQQLQNEFDVYHNPILNQVLITNKSGKHFSGQMNLYSITGQLVESVNRTWTPGYNQVQLSGHYNEIYILEIRHDEGVFRRKLLLE